MDGRRRGFCPEDGLLAIREALKLSPGQRVQMVVYGNRIEMIPLRTLSEMKGLKLWQEGVAAEGVAKW
jgi:bifunctional DNA-binding transcriptional regulator/antitoxin component of YhaV-PrlF toxin-antitoxin module